ncbi:CAP domain-containing protein [Streptomyces sp. NPDC051776]|uniref:CAP domain-containing protein n=1 Tax=Streptomyces sp. NPDC051776 TaxID=3155414 RepID=UPI00342217B8
MASGLMPGGDDYTVGGAVGKGTQVETGGIPGFDPQGTASSTPTGRPSSPIGRGSDPTGPPSSIPSRSHQPEKPSEPSQRPSGSSDDDSKPSAPRPPKGKQEKPGRVPGSTESESSAEAKVLRLVNKERKEAGCRPVKRDKDLADLAEAFSEDMADRDFFDHTDPDGENPWDRADVLGIIGLGGENIARGQQDAEAVVDAWMASPGHRANILNCDYKKMGVGAQFGEGGPWWTQDFGF